MPRGKEPMEEEHCLNNWDLDAVVRFACRRRRLSQPPQHDPFASLPPPPPVAPAPEAVKEQEADAGWCFPDLCAGEASGFGRDADELLKAFCAAPPPLPLPPPLPTPQQEQQQLQPVMTPADVPLQTAAPASAPERAQPSRRQVSGGVPRSKRRKNQQKKVVCHVPADGVSADVWAWRKYGQKPIKGSPYPRGYYRCSSSKGCAARKQVERSRADPNTFILTYTGEHNHAAPTHRNSLAGTTRHKFPSPASSAPQPPPPSVVVAAETQHLSPPSTSAGLSPTTPLRTPSMEEEDDDELFVEDMDIAGEDDLLFLNGDSDAAALVDGSSATPMSSLFDEPLLGSPWASATAGEAAAGAASAGS